jgi:hypothetical protein
MLCLFLQIVCPDCPSLGVTGCEIDSETEGCSYETARCFEVSGLFIDVACFGKFWPPGRKYNRWLREFGFADISSCFVG